jgi:hypothetical protein
LAERSISARLVLKVAEFIAGGNAAKRTLSDLNSKFVETAGFAAGFRKKLDDAFKKLPKIEIDANSTPAEVKVAELRRKLEELRDKKVGVDINATAALAEMHLIQRELASIDDRDVSFDVRAGISGAMAELAAIDSEIGRLDGRTANVNVDADISGALRGFATVAAAGAALAAAPIIVTVGASAVGLGAAFGAAGAGAGAFGLAAMGPLSRVNEALKETQSAAGGAGGAMKSAGQKAAEAAQNSLKLAQAQERVRKAEESVKDASRGVVQAREDVRKAEDDVARAASEGAARVAAAVRQVASAESSYTAAVKDAQRAQEALNVARRDAARDLEDLGNRLTDTQIAQRSAALGLKDAQKQLNAVQGNKRATADDIERASIAYAEAQQRVKELATDVQRLTVDKADADKKGVEGSDQVRAAQDQVAAANQRVVDSQQAIADAQAGVAQAQTEAARGVADAQDRVLASQEKLLDSQRRYQDAQRDAILAEKALKVERLQQAAATSAAGAAAGGAASKMSQLTEAEQKLARHLQGSKDDFRKWQESLEKDVFPAITGGVDLVISQLPRISPLVRTAGKSFVDLEKDAKKALEDPFWDKFLHRLDREMPGAFDHLGSIAGNTFKGAVGIFNAFLPYTGTLLERVDKISQKFADWGVNLGDSSSFHRFMAFAKENGPQVWQTIENIAISAGHIVAALAPFGVASLNGLALLAKITASMSPGEIQAIALAVGAVYTAVKVGQGVSAALGFLENLNTKLGTVGSTASGLKGKIGGALGFLGAGGPWGLAIGAGIAAIGLFADAQDSAKEKFKDVTDALDTQTGAITKNAREAVKAALVNDGSAQRAKDLGVNLKDLVDASLDPTSAAAKRVNDQLLKSAVAFDSLHPKVRAAGDATKFLTGDAMKLQTEISGSTGAIADQRDKLADLAAMDGKVLGGQKLLNDSYKAAKDALDRSNGSLDLSTAKTDAQRAAIVLAREKFAGFITDVGTLADKQATLTGKSKDATVAVAEQLPKLFELAGKSKDAREQVFELAKKYGISREEAIKATGSAKDFKEMLAKLKSPPPIKLSMDDGPARGVLNKLLRDIGLAQPNLSVGVLKKNASGGVLPAYAAGGVEAYAAGGARSTPPFIAAKPTILLGEGRDREYFIPTDPQFRSRSIDFLSQAAAEFGLQLMPANGVLAQSTGTAMKKSSSSTGASITREVVPIKKSKPQIGTAVSTVQPSNLIEGSQAGGATSSSSAGSSVSIEMNGTVIREEADIDRLSERLLFKARTRR